MMEMKKMAMVVPQIARLKMDGIASVETVHKKMSVTNAELGMTPQRKKTTDS